MTICGAACRVEIAVKMSTEAVEKQKGRVYGYSTLKEAKEKTTINIFGVVKYFKEPQRTRTADVYMVLSIIDPSLEDGDREKLKIVLFAPKADDLPPIQNEGDIVRMHRLKISSYRGELQGQNGPGFSCLVFDGCVGGSLEPLTASASYTLRHEDEVKIEELRLWANKRSSIGAQPVSTIVKLADITPGQYCNLACQVIATCVMKKDEACLLQVWDGSKIQYPCWEVDLINGKLDGQINSDVKLCRKARPFKVDVLVFDDHFQAAAKLQPGDFIQLINLHVVHKAASTGTSPVVELCLHRGGGQFNRTVQALDEASINRLKKDMQFGDDDTFIDSDESCTESPSILPDNQVRNGRILPSGPQLFPKQQISGHSLGSTFPANLTKERGGLDDASDDMDTRDEDWDQTLLTCMQRTGAIITDHHYLQPSSVSKVLRQDRDRTSQLSIHRLKVQLMHFQPKATCAAEFLTLHCMVCNCMTSIPSEPVPGLTTLMKQDGLDIYKCPTCSKEDTTSVLQYSYFVQLIVGDDSGYTMVQLWKDQARKFFHDIPAQRLMKDEKLFHNLYNQLQNLCPHEGEEDKQPWIECCVNACMTQQGLCFQMVDTSLAFSDD